MTKVKFWIDHSNHSLCVQNIETNETKTIHNQKQIAFFLNAHNLTSHQVKGTMNGFDALKLFEKRKFPHFLPRLKREQS